MGHHGAAAADPDVAEPRGRAGTEGPVRHLRAWAKLPEADRLKKTIDSWWTEIEAFIDTRVTNAHTEAANVTMPPSSDGATC